MTTIICFGVLLGISFCSVIGTELYVGMKRETK